MSGQLSGWVVSRPGSAGKGDKENPTVPGGTMGAGLRANNPGTRFQTNGVSEWEGFGHRSAVRGPIWVSPSTGMKIVRAPSRRSIHRSLRSRHYGRALLSSGLTRHPCSPRCGLTLVRRPTPRLTRHHWSGGVISRQGALGITGGVDTHADVHVRR